MTGPRRRRRALPGSLFTAALLALVSALPADAAKPKKPPSHADAVRFLEQATFGPTEAEALHVMSVGFAPWLDEQLAAPPSLYPDLPPYPGSSAVGCPDGTAPPNCYRDNYTMYPLEVRFFLNALSGKDQLRQRVAFALHQILVVSGVTVKQPSSMSPYLNVLANDALGSYRALLEDVTLNPAMGDYLDMANNDKANASGTIQPNENYGREVLQLFSVGLYLLNPDGTLQKDAQQQPIPTYDQDTIEGFAHVFTGWTYPTAPGATPLKHNPRYYIGELHLWRDGTGVDATHDKGAKELLSYPGAAFPTLPPNQDGALDLARALDNIAGHPNAGPFLGRQLIQHLVTSNPSPAYVARVAAKFADNGKGVRGDLFATVKQVLLDPEARSASPDASFGHLREPALFLTALCRAYHAASDGILNDQIRPMGQDLFNSPSVFNYYPHEYAVPGTALEGPEFGIESSTAAIQRVNVVNSLAFSHIQPPSPATGTTLDLTGLVSVAGVPSQLVDSLDQLLMHGTMSTPMKDTIAAAVGAISSSNPTLRAQTAFYLVASSSPYQVVR